MLNVPVELYMPGNKADAAPCEYLPENQCCKKISYCIRIENSVNRKWNEIKEPESTMIIDFHVHTFHEQARADRKAHFSGEPEFKLLYDSPKSRMSDVPEIINMMDDEGVDISVICGFPWRDPENFRRNNDHVIEAVIRYPHRLKGLCCMDLFSKEAEKEVERCLDAGISGVGELAFYKSGIDKACLERLDPVMEICMKKKLPVLIHTNEPVGHRYPGKTPNTLSQIYAMAKRYPENRIVLAHWGGGIFLYSLLKKEIGDVLKNIYYDTAASPFLYDTRIYTYAKDLVGAEKILFGTDYPLLKPSRYAKEMKTAGISVSDMEKICGLNSAALLGLTA